MPSCPPEPGAALPRAGSCAEAADTAHRPRFAVVIRTYQWDAFIARQVARYQAVSDGGDLFVSADMTHGTVGPIEHHRVFSTTNDGLLALGLANRFEKGSLIWWNADYPAYAFHRAYPGYDYYVFVEYDSLVRHPLAPMVREVARRQLDFVAAPIPSPLTSWFWFPYARHAYGADELRATLNCISFYSARALEMLFERRMEMARDPRVRSWPISEAFVATEIERAGYAAAPLSMLGDDGAYDWFPPVLEQDLDALDAGVFVHPVLDEPRYLKSVLTNGGHWRDYFDASSALHRRLSRLPRESYAPLLLRASWRRFKALQKERLETRLLKVRLAWQS